MKLFKIIAVLLFGIISVNGFGQKDAITRFFDKYIDDENFTVVYISPKVFDMISTMSDEAEDIDEMKKVLSDLEGIRILTTELDAEKYYKEALNTLRINEYELLMQVRDKNENVRFFVKDNGPVVSELLLLVGGKEDFVLMSFVGKIELKNISKLSKSLNIEGAEHLEELEDK
jgi:vacuolar-type H+-ATPase subunit F/Vma7